MPTKTASGIPVWPSRDPIEEMGGINLYGFVLNDPVAGFDAFGLVLLKNCKSNKFSFTKALRSPKGRALNVGSFVGYIKEDFDIGAEGEVETCCKVCPDGTESIHKTWTVSGKVDAHTEFHFGFGKYVKFGPISGMISIGVGGSSGGVMSLSGSATYDGCTRQSSGSMTASGAIVGKLGAEGMGWLSLFGKSVRARAGVYGNVSVKSSVYIACSGPLCNWKAGEVEFAAWLSLEVGVDAGRFGEYEYYRNLGGFRGIVDDSGIGGSFPSPFN